MPIRFPVGRTDKRVRATADTVSGHSGTPEPDAGITPPALSDAATIEPLSERRKLALALMAAASLFMETLDATALSPALPTIASEFAVPPLHLGLAVSSYIVVLAMFIPVSGWAADRFGTRRVFSAAIAVFLTGSILCSFATDLPSLIMGRVVQGLGGAFMSPVARLVVLKVCRKDEIVQMMAWVTVPGLIGPVVGPALGGFMTTYLDWRWLFLVNVPIGLIGIALAWRLIPHVEGSASRRLDIAGLALVGLGSASLVFSIDLLASGAVDRRFGVALAICAVVLLAGYGVHYRRTVDPLVDLGLFLLPTFCFSVVGGLFFRFGIGSTPILLPLLFQLGFGLDAFASGLLFACATVGALAMKIMVPAVISRVSYRRLLIVNGMLNAIGFASAAIYPFMPWPLLVSVLVFSGLIRSLQFTALNTIAFADVAPERLSRATTLLSMGMQVGLSLGVGIGSALVAIFQGSRSLAEDPAAAISPAFLVLGGLCVIHALAALLLPADAGDALRRRSR